MNSKLFSKAIYVFTGVVIGIGITIGLRATGLDEKAAADDAYALLKGTPTNDRKCEAFERLASLRRGARSRVMLGEMYARGYCAKFDLSRAVYWLQQGELSSPVVGSVIFKAAMTERSTDTHQVDALSDLEVSAAFRKAADLGFKPEEKDLAKLSQEQASLFTR